MLSEGGLFLYGTYIAECRSSHVHYTGIIGWSACWYRPAPKRKELHSRVQVGSSKLLSRAQLVYIKLQKRTPSPRRLLVLAPLVVVPCCNEAGVVLIIVYHIGARPLLSVWFLTTERYKRMCLLTRVYGIPHDIYNEAHTHNNDWRRPKEGRNITSDSLCAYTLKLVCTVVF